MDLGASTPSRRGRAVDWLGTRRPISLILLGTAVLTAIVALIETLARG